MSNNAGMMPAGANQIASSKASAGIFINIALAVYVLGFIYKWAITIDDFKDVVKDNKQIGYGYKVTMFLGAISLLIGLSRAIGVQYDLTRFFILAIAIGLNVFFDDVYENVMGSGKKGKKGKKNKNKKN